MIYTVFYPKKPYQGFYRFNDESPEQYPDGVFLRGVQLDGTDQWVDSWENLLTIPEGQQIQM